MTRATPRPLLRRVAGAPITRDGQRLDTETQVVLKMMALSGKPDPGSLGATEAGPRCSALEKG